MENIRVEIRNWEKFNELRRDVKNPTWWRCQIALPTDADLFHLTAEEKWVWVCLLSHAASKRTGELDLDLDWFSWLCRVEKKVVKTCLEKLKDKTIQIVDVRGTSTGRARDVHIPLQTDRQTDRQTHKQTPIAPPCPTVEVLVEVWEANKDPGLPAIKALTPKRRAQASERLRENPDPEYWAAVVKRISASKFCCGDNDRKWKANFDWLLKPDTHIRTMEGRYDNPAVSSEVVLAI